GPFNDGPSLRLRARPAPFSNRGPGETRRLAKSTVRHGGVLVGRHRAVFFGRNDRPGGCPVGSVPVGLDDGAGVASVRCKAPADVWNPSKGGAWAPARPARGSGTDFLAQTGRSLDVARPSGVPRSRRRPGPLSRPTSSRSSGRAAAACRRSEAR